MRFSPLFAQLLLRAGVLLLSVLLLGRLLYPARENPSIASHQPPALDEEASAALQLLHLYAEADESPFWTDAQQQRLLSIMTRLHNQAAVEALLADAAFSESLSAENLPALWLIVRERLHEDLWEEAAQILGQILAIDAENPQANLWLALLLLPDNPEGLAYLQNAARFESVYQAQAASLLGIVSVVDWRPLDVGIRLVDSGDWPLAERYLSLQLDLFGADALSYAYRGYVREQRGRDGFSDIENAIALAPSDPLPYYMQGHYHRNRGNLAAALRAFSDAYSLAPDNPAFAAEVATTHQQLSDFATAAEWWAIASSLSGDDVRFMALEAAFYADENYLLDGFGYLRIQEAAALFPSEAAIQASLARAQHLRGELDSAEETYQIALELAPNDYRLRYYWATFLTLRGRYEEASGHYAYVAAAPNPYQEAAQAALGR